MDQFVKDHPCKAAAIRTQSSNSELRSFEFEELPPTARHRIYEECMLAPKHNDDESADLWIYEHAELSDWTEGLIDDRDLRRRNLRNLPGNHEYQQKKSTKKPLLFCTERTGSHGVFMILKK